MLCTLSSTVVLYSLLSFSPKANIPVISTLCNHGIRPRHWKQMSDIIGFDITPDSGSTLRKFLKFNLGPCMTEFEAISVAASKVL